MKSCIKGTNTKPQPVCGNAILYGNATANEVILRLTSAESIDKENYFAIVKLYMVLDRTLLSAWSNYSKPATASTARLPGAPPTHKGREVGGPTLIGFHLWGWLGFEGFSEIYTEIFAICLPWSIFAALSYSARPLRDRSLQQSLKFALLPLIR